MTLLVVRGKQVASSCLSMCVEAADVKLWVGRTSGARLREHDRGNVIE